MSVKKLLLTLIVLFALYQSILGSDLKSSIYNYDWSAINEIDPFAEYLNSVPFVLETISNTNSGTGDEAITTREIIFSSRKNINKIYGILAYPKKAGKYPGILVIHGGSGNAVSVKGVVERFARKGYVAFACDMAGFCNTDNTPYSSGPWKLKPAPDERPRFNIAGGLQNSSLVDSEVAGIEAFNLLRTQANVDSNKIGITGYSWGGYSTTMLAGLLGSKVKAAYSYWGCGYYDKGSFWQERIAKLPDSIRKKWLTYFDAGRRAPGIKANYFIEAASNDTYFWPEAVSATLQAIPGPKNHVWGPNVNHKEVATSATMQELYFDYYLKGRGRAFSTIEISKVIKQKDNTEQVTMKLKIPAGITIQSVRLYYSKPDAKWQTRVWMPLNAERKNDHTYSVIIPAKLVSNHVNFYAYLTDSRNVVTSSYMY